MPSYDPSGHRARLRERFLNREQAALSEEALLELLLTYAIPQKDVRPLASELLARLGGLQGVLCASPDTLMGFDGVKAATATLIKLVAWLREYQPVEQVAADPPEAQPVVAEPAQATQASLFEEAPPEEVGPSAKPDQARPRKVISKTRTGLFGKAVLQEAIDLLPRMPDTESLDDLRVFLRGALHYSAEETRIRFGNYIIRRMFPFGYGDRAMRQLAAAYAGRQELREVCFYRFCLAEPLMYRVLDDLILPAISRGRLERGAVTDFLAQLHPSAARNTLQSCSQAITDALVAGGIAQADREQLSFGYRDVLPDSFAFVLYSEFPEPGIYPIASLEDNQAIRAMLWNPARLLPMLYELRNRGLLSKVSEIDSVRQFTTHLNLEDAVATLTTRRAQP